MDYEVGSLSDLITGVETPNKVKVVRNKFVPKTQPLNEEKSLGKQSKKLHKVYQTSIQEKAIDEKQKLNIENVELGSKKSNAINDLNAERRIKTKTKVPKVIDSPEIMARTIFVGNLPIITKPAHIKKLFSRYGNIESVRIRGVPVSNPKTPKKVAMIKKEYHPDRTSFNGYVKFETEDEAKKALEANGLVYKEHHLRVTLCNANENPDANKAIFVGNLDFKAEEDDLWKIFEICGKIQSVRIIRDSRTGLAKGFAYINFEKSDSVQLALEMENVNCKDRELRISSCSNNGPKKKKVKGNKITEKRNANKNTNSSKNSKEQLSFKNSAKFQGSKFMHKKKKNTVNKGLFQKKKLAQKVVPFDN